MSSDRRSADHPGAGLPRVLLLLDAAGDRRVLTSWLCEHYDVIQGAREASLEEAFDLCILDDGSYARLRRWVTDLKRRSEPTFLPFMLITARPTSHLVAEVPKHDLDELIEAPVQPDVLRSRVGVLLERRFRELTLEAEREQVLAKLQQSEEAARRELSYTRLLEAAAEAAATGTSTSEVAANVLDALVKHMSLKMGTLSVYDEREDQLVMLAQRGMSPDLASRCARFPISEHAPTLVSQAAAKKLIVTSADAPRTVEREELLRSSNSQHTQNIAVPLLWQDRLMGVLSFVFEREQDFTTEERELYTSLSRIISQAFENASLFEHQRERRRRIEALHGVLEVAVSSLDLHASADRLLHYLVERHGFELANLWFVSDGALKLAAAVGYPSAYAERFSPMSLSGPYDAAQVAVTGEPIAVPDATRSNPAVREMYDSIGLQLGSYVILPMSSRGRVIGTLHFGWHEPRTINEHDMEFYRSIAGEIGIVLENTRLFEAQKTELGNRQVLQQAAASAASSLDAKELSTRVLAAAAQGLGAVAGNVHLLSPHDDREAKLLASFGYPESELPRLRVVRMDESTLAGTAITTGMTQVSGAEEPPAETARRQKRMGLEDTRLVAVPLKARGRVFGLLGLAFPGQRDFTLDEVALLEAIADQLSVGLQNAQLYAAEHNIADRLQEALLALPTEVRGVEFAHSYHSATDTARVGGDFYDLFELNHSHVGIVIGDVAGKGIDAAVLTSMVKNTIRAHANERGKTPAQILELTNAVVYRATASESFVTIFFGMLDCRDGRLVYGNAGHTTAAVIRPGGIIGKLPVTGPLLGAFEDVEYAQEEVHLEPQDLLFLYTDGLTEARRNGEFFTEERAFKVLASVDDARPGNVVQAVIGEVLDFTNCSLRDDLAIMAVRRSSSDSEDTPQQQKLAL